MNDEEPTLEETIAAALSALHYIGEALTDANRLASEQLRESARLRRIVERHLRTEAPDLEVVEAA